MVAPLFWGFIFDEQWLPPCFGALFFIFYYFYYFFFALFPLGFKALVLDKLFATNLLFCSCDNISLTVYNIPGSAN